MALVVEDGTGKADAESYISAADAKVEWRAIPGWEGLYEVSADGDVRSLGRFVSRSQGGYFRPGRLLRPGRNPAGYLFVSLCRDGHQSCCNIHRLVAMAFHERLGAQTEVNHKDGNKANNKAANLEWCTASENMLHAFSSGLREKVGPAPRRGLLNPAAKLTPEQVVELRSCRAAGKTFSEVAEEFAVSASHAYRICAGHRQGHIGSAA